MLRSDITNLTASLCLACAAVLSPTLRAQQPSPTPTAGTVAAEPSAAPFELPSLGDELMESGTLEQPGLEAVESVSEPVGATGGEKPRAGRWKVSPHLRLDATYDDNIFIQPKDKVADFVFTAAPGIAIGYWDYEEEMERFLDRDRSAAVIDRGTASFLVVDYTAILLGFVRTPSQNALDQDARFDVRWRLEKLTLGASSHFESKSEANIDVGGRVRRTAVATEVTADYQLSERTSVAVGFYNVIQDRENFVRTLEWRNEDYFDYQLTPLLRVGLGGAAGRVEVEDRADQVFERILARANFESTAKLVFDARGGVEFRQSDGPSGDRVNPVFDLTARYSLAEATLVVLNGYRRVEPSASQRDEDYAATGVSLRFERTLRTGLRFSAEGGYEHTEYTDSSGLDPRRDDFFYVRAGLLYNFAHWGNAGVSYEYRQNDSSRASSGFENNRVTFQISLVY